MDPSKVFQTQLSMLQHSYLQKRSLLFMFLLKMKIQFKTKQITIVKHFQTKAAQYEHTDYYFHWNIAIKVILEIKNRKATCIRRKSKERIQWIHLYSYAYFCCKCLNSKTVLHIRQLTWMLNNANGEPKQGMICVHIREKVQSATVHLREKKK